MRVLRRLASVLGVWLVGLVPVLAQPAAQAAAAPLTDAQLSARVEALLARMTLEEKVGQLTQIAGGLFPGAKPE